MSETAVAAECLSDTVLYWLFRAGAWVVPRLPRHVAYAFADAAALGAYYTARPARRNLYANLQVVFATLPPQERERRIRRTMRRCFRTAAWNYVDLFRIPLLRVEELDRVLDVEGWEHIEAALHGGKGLVLCMAHFGNVDWVGQYFVLHGFQAWVPMEVPRSRRLWDLLVHLRGSKGLHIVPEHNSLRTLLRALRRNEIVGIAADFLPRGAHGVPVRFFGRTTRLPEGPAGLARLSGAPISMAFALRLPGGRFQAWVEPLFFVPRTDNESADLIAGTQRLAEMMERAITRDPGQWVMFRRLWPAEEGTPESVAGALAGGRP
jgi:KDO2-lipid IV(A) lauroyltransferase